MKKQAVLIVGASVRWAAHSAATAGFPVIGMDLFGDQDTLAQCRRFVLITSAMYDDASVLQETISAISQQEHAAVVTVGGLRPLATAAIEPELLQQLASSAGFQFPEFFQASTSPGPPPGDWLFKQAGSTGGLGVRRGGPSVTARGPGYWQRRILGRPHGVVALANHDRVCLLGITQSIYVRHGGLPYVYAGSRTVSRDASVPWAAMQSLAENIAAQRGLRGLFNIDWICDWQNCWWLLEVNERPSASCEVLERAACYPKRHRPDDSLMSWHLDALGNKRCHDTLRSVPRRDHASVHIKRIVYSRANGTVDLSSLPPQWRRDPSSDATTSDSIRIHVADRPAPGTPVASNQPIATVLIDAPEMSPSLPRLLRHAIDRVRGAVHCNTSVSVLD